MAVNPKDPLLKSGPDRQRELFDAFCKVAHGFSTEEAIGAAVNVLVNGIRQAHATQRGAVSSFEQTTTRARELLASHYDALGKRRNVFPFHQVIEVPHFIDRDGFKRG